MCAVCQIDCTQARRPLRLVKFKSLHLDLMPLHLVHRPIVPFHPLILLTLRINIIQYTSIIFNIHVS